ncbi:MAG: efflux RND transporter periplasmic adaptor subunit [Haemophilus parainfluenzae]|nr:efflux RND transporter periplasmic adaptor subunit [Haemophilus parainfluenzae]
MSITQTNRPKRSHVFFLKLALGVFVLIFAAMIFLNQMKAKGIADFLANKPETASPVTAMTVKASEWTPIIETTGLVRPNQGAMLSAQSAGTVSKVLVQNGQSVNANLAGSGAVSRQELDNAKAAYEAQAANIESLKATIERRQIVAPFDGKAGIVKVNVGQYVSNGTEIVRVEDRSSMKVDFAIAQNLLDKLHIGQKVTATADARKGETFAAKVTAIEPAINSSTGLVDVQATFEPEDGAKLLSGMFTRLHVALPTEHNQIVVPQVAVSYNMYGESLYILTALSDEDIEKLGGAEKAANMYRAKSITVFTKDRQGIYAQLKGDEVKVGDKIVTGGQQNLSNGSLVSVVDKAGVGTEQPANKTNL